MRTLTAGRYQFCQRTLDATRPSKWRLTVPKLPRTWTRFSSNILDTRDSVLYVGPTITPGQTMRRCYFKYRIEGYTNESTFYDIFDAYYIGIALVDIFEIVPDQAAWTQRSTRHWLWWEGAHADVVFGVGTPGRAHFTYPRDPVTIDPGSQRLVDTVEFPNGASVVFCFARSGGVVLSDQRVNVVGGVLTLG